MFYLISVEVLLEIAHCMGCVSRWFYYGFKVVENKKRACLLYDTPSLKRYFMIFIFLFLFLLRLLFG